MIGYRKFFLWSPPPKHPLDKYYVRSVEFKNHEGASLPFKTQIPDIERPNIYELKTATFGPENEYENDWKTSFETNGYGKIRGEAAPVRSLMPRFKQRLLCEDNGDFLLMKVLSTDFCQMRLHKHPKYKKMSSWLVDNEYNRERFKRHAIHKYYRTDWENGVCVRIPILEITSVRKNALKVEIDFSSPTNGLSMSSDKAVAQAIRENPQDRKWIETDNYGLQCDEAQKITLIFSMAGEEAAEDLKWHLQHSVLAAAHLDKRRTPIGNEVRDDLVERWSKLVKPGWRVNADRLVEGESGFMFRGGKKVENIRVWDLENKFNFPGGILVVPVYTNSVTNETQYKLPDASPAGYVQLDSSTGNSNSSKDDSTDSKSKDDPNDANSATSSGGESQQQQQQPPAVQVNQSEKSSQMQNSQPVATKRRIIRTHFSNTDSHPPKSQASPSRRRRSSLEFEKNLGKSIRKLGQLTIRKDTNKRDADQVSENGARARLNMDA